MYINLAPLLLNLMECFTTLIFNRPIDFGSPTYPVSIFSVGSPYKHYDCNITAEEVAGFQYRQMSRICHSVLRNFHTKGIKCVGIMSMFPAKGLGQTDIYWLLNYYWSRGEEQSVEYMDKVFESASALSQVFPVNIKIQTLVTEDYLSSGTATKYAEWKQEWTPFLWLPIVVICIPEAEKNYIWKIGFVFNGLPPHLFTRIPINSSSLWLFEGQLIEEVHRYSRNKLKLHINSMGENAGEFLKLLRLEVGGNQSIRLRIDHRGILLVTGLDVAQFGGSNFHSIFLSHHRYSAVTCTGYNDLATFANLVTPFDLRSWLCLCLVIVCTSLLFRMSAKYREMVIQIPQILISLFLENSYTIKEKLNGPPVRVVMVVYLFMGIVLSNGYKGALNTSTVMPFEAPRQRSLEAALLERNYKVKDYIRDFGYGATLATLHKVCCRTPEGLSYKVDSKLFPSIPKSAEEGFMECGDILSRVLRIHSFVPIYTGKTEEIFDRYEYEIMNGKLYNMAPFENESQIERIRRKLVQNTEIFSCGCDTLGDEILDCKKSIAVVASNSLDETVFTRIQESNFDKQTGKKLYEIKDTHGIFVSKIRTIRISYVNVAREIIWRVIRMFEESGMVVQWQAKEKIAQNTNASSILRTMFAKLPKKSSELIRLNMTYIYYTFLLYLFCSVGGITLFVAEILNKRKSLCFIHCRRIYYLIQENGLKVFWKKRSSNKKVVSSFLVRFPRCASFRANMVLWTRR